jgi:putative PEP-CTERM system TPR-repeat lipoprotein
MAINTNRGMRWVGVLGVALCAVVVAACGGEDSPERLTASAKQYFAKRDYAAAVIQLKNALRQTPQNAELRYLLGAALLERRDPSSAEKELRRALELNYPAERVYAPLARALIETGQIEKVVQELADKTSADLDEAASLATSLGRAYLALGRPNEARDAFAGALTTKPDYAPAELGEARLLASEGKFSDAAQRVEEVLAKSPVHADALFLKGELLVAQGNGDAAIPVFEQAADANPSDIAPRRALISLLIDKRDFTQAAAHLERAKRAAKGDPRVDFLEALLALREGKPALAREAILRVLKNAPDHVPSLVLAGAVEYQAGAFVAAEDYLRKSLDRAPRQTYARRLLVGTYLRLGQGDRALDTLQPLLAQAPDDPVNMRLAAEVHLANGDLNAAALAVERLASGDAQAVAVRTRLAQMRFAAGEVDRAVKDLEVIAEQNPESVQADIALVLGYLRRNEADKALGATKRLEKKQPKNALSHNLTGAAQLARRDSNSARASFEQALALDPAYLPALKNLATLDLQEENPAQARKRFEDAIAAAPSNAQILLAFAEFLRTTGGEQKEVGRVVERAVAASPTTVAPRLAMIDFQMRAGDAKKALIAAQEANVAMPGEPRLLEALGVMQQANGEINQAITSFQKLVAASPQGAGPLVRLAGAYAAAKDYTAAVQTLRKALPLQPNATELNRELALLYVHAGRVDEALAEARSVQTRKPKDASGFVIEGDVFAAQKKWSEAAGAYRGALASARTPAHLIRLHTALDAAGDAKGAEQIAQSWLKEKPAEAAVRTYLAERDLRRKEYASAAQHYRVLHGQAPNNAAVLNNLAWVSGQLNDPQALSYAERANRLAPNNPAVLDTFGWLLVEKGETGRGIKLLEKAVGIAPGAQEIRLNLAKALLKSGRKDAARKELETLASASAPNPVKDGAAKLLQSL